MVAHQVIANAIRATRVPFTPLADLITSLRADLATAAAVTAELQLEKEATERALTGANVEASLLRSQLASARVGPDQVVVLKADYERLIASLPVRQPTRLAIAPPVACLAQIINRSTGKQSFCSLAPDHEGLHEGPTSHDS